MLRNRLRRIGRAPVFAAALTLAAAAPAAAERFVITPGAAGNEVRFVSKAPMESFAGHTARVAGEVECDPGALADSCHVHVTVDLASLDTGIGLRNQHMRENHLETDRYPEAVFAGARLHGAPAALAPGQAARFELAGSFTLHGVSRPLRVPVEVTLHEAAGRRELVVAGAFPVSLADHGISRPRFLLLKLGEVQQASFVLTAVSEGAPQ